MEFPTLNTERLILRQVNEGDISRLVKYIDKRISDQIVNFPHPYTEEDTRKRIEFVQNGFNDGARYVFAICKSSSNELIGEIGIHLDDEHNRAEVGYWIAAPFWGKGFASEALYSVLDFGFNNIGLHKIMATHYPDNPSSGKVLIKNGMVKEAELVDHYKTVDGYKTVVQYRLTAEEFRSK